MRARDGGRRCLTPMFSIRLALLDFDESPALRGLWALGRRDPQYAFLKLSHNLVFVDVFGQPDRAAEAAKAALGEVVALLLLLALGLLLALDGEQAVVKAHLDILLVDAGQINLDDEFPVLVADINVRAQPIVGEEIAPEEAREH